MVYNIRRINLWGGPGSGKSSTAAELYAGMKRSNLTLPETKRKNIELVREYAKEFAWENKSITGYDQLFISIEQLRREVFLLKNGVDLIITDCPAMLGYLYAQWYDSFCQDQIYSIMSDYEEKYPSVNIVLDREDRPYDQNGRFQSLTKAKEMDVRIKEFLEDEYTDDVYPVRPILAKQDDNLFEIVKKYL